MNSSRSQILKLIREDKEFRDQFVAEHIFARLPLKVRILRKTGEMTQQQLADKAGVKKEWISQVENPNYGRFTLKTLLKIASALDVALHVDFVPYSTVANDALRLSIQSFHVPSAAADVGLLERFEAANVVSIADARKDEPIQRLGDTRSKNPEIPNPPSRRDAAAQNVPPPMDLKVLNQKVG